MAKGADGKHKLAGDYGAHPGFQLHTTRFLSVDPGDVHVGVAEFVRVTGGVWFVEWAREMTPDEFLLYFFNGVRKHAWHWVVVEEWRLFPEQAPRSVGSDMPTSRLIGGIQALAKHAPTSSWPDTGEDRLPVYFQSPKIKVPTRSWLKRRKMRSVAKIMKVAGDHATDAELHGYHYLIKQDEPVWNAVAQNKYYPPLTASHDLW